MDSCGSKERYLNVLSVGSIIDISTMLAGFRLANERAMLHSNILFPLPLLPNKIVFGFCKALNDKILRLSSLPNPKTKCLLSPISWMISYRLTVGFKSYFSLITNSSSSFVYQLIFWFEKNSLILSGLLSIKSTAFLPLILNFKITDLNIIVSLIKLASIDSDKNKVVTFSCSFLLLFLSSWLKSLVGSSRNPKLFLAVIFLLIFSKNIFI